MRRSLNPMLQIALTANIFEWYEFSLTAFMALEIGRLFFPAAADKTALMLSFSVFASSYLARPVGSACFGFMGNRYGAATALKLSMIGMAIPASLIAFLPTYAMAGYWASGLLIALKILQGFAAGGEVPLSGYYVACNTKGRERGLYCAFVSISGFLGMLLASFIIFVLPYCVILLTRLLPGGMSMQLAHASWRWPFLLCMPLSAWIFSLRSRMPAVATEARSPIPPPSARRPVAPLVQAFVLVAFMEMQLYTVFVWLPSYLHTYLGVATADARASNVIALLAFSAAMVGAGYATRWVAPSRLVLLGIVSQVLATYPLFLLLQSQAFAWLLTAQIAFAVLAACMVGVIFIVLSDLFRETWHSFGMAVSYAIPTALFGGTAPLVCGYLIERMHTFAAPALYIVAMGLLAMPVAYRLAVRVTDNNRSISALA
jgi:MHS family proline/betaine transporter-like MFS transporter